MATAIAKGRSPERSTFTKSMHSITSGAYRQPAEKGTGTRADDDSL
ncbi:hypothetical protein HMPREF1986_01036 [Oribacterium sp. oral taxon 078 str. F0263]|nr:hypothetical protein HMPREF1986_01036 [Oribacterium sp. oral taxon 078 str. F0263]